MRIGVDGRHLGGGSPSGVGQYTLAVLRAMAIAHPEHEFLILSTGSPYTAKQNVRKALKDLLERENVSHVHRAVMNRALNLSLLLFGRPSFETLFGKPVDVTWCPNLNFLPRSQSPIVVTFHDLSFAMMPHLYSSKRRLWHRLVRPRKIVRQASAVIVPSKTTAMDLERLYRLKEKKIEIIPHGVDEVFSPRPEPQDHGVRSRHDLPRHYLLHVGTDEPRKNCVRLARAFETAKKRSETMRRLDMKLVLVGASQAVYRLPITNYQDILRLGYIPDADRPALYRGAAALVFPSLYEGFGMPILEAFASGTPVITSQNSAMLEVGGGAALFVDPENEADIARAIEEVVESRELQDHLIQKGLERAELFSWRSAAEETLRVFEEHAIYPLR